MSKQQISNYERGKRLPSVLVLVRLAVALKVKVGKLLGVE